MEDQINELEEVPEETALTTGQKAVVLGIGILGGMTLTAAFLAVSRFFKNRNKKVESLEEGGPPTEKEAEEIPKESNPETLVPQKGPINYGAMFDGGILKENIKAPVEVTQVRSIEPRFEIVGEGIVLKTSWVSVHCTYWLTDGVFSVNSTGKELGEINPDLSVFMKTQKDAMDGVNPLYVVDRGQNLVYLFIPQKKSHSIEILGIKEQKPEKAEKGQKVGPPIRRSSKRKVAPLEDESDDE